MPSRQSAFDAGASGRRPVAWLLLASFSASLILLTLSFAIVASGDSSLDADAANPGALGVLAPIMFTLGLLGASTTGTVLLYDLVVRALAAHRVLLPTTPNPPGAGALMTEESGLLPPPGAPSSIQTSSGYGTVRSSYAYDGMLALEAGWAPVLAIAASSSPRGSRQNSPTSAHAKHKSEASVGISTLHAERD
ncbi:hypothetical protein MKEN_00230300 [Mycena kentingensis (nom. inval.)]|nr:hypothetical protein MKEN_00230300 [Mycena kentingensis (nom. inval.)]